MGFFWKGGWRGWFDSGGHSHQEPLGPCSPGGLRELAWATQPSDSSQMVTKRAPSLCWGKKLSGSCRQGKCQELFKIKARIELLLLLPCAKKNHPGYSKPRRERNPCEIHAATAHCGAWNCFVDQSRVSLLCLHSFCAEVVLPEVLCGSNIGE